jgi:hypothetical protein
VDAHIVGYYAPAAGTGAREGLGHRDGAKRKARALTSILGCDLGLHNFHGLPRPIIMVADEGPHRRMGEKHGQGQYKGRSPAVRAV